MRYRYNKKLLLIMGLMLLGFGITYGSMYLLKDEIIFFYTPEDVHLKGIINNKDRVKIGGQVEVGSLLENDYGIEFDIVDSHNYVHVKHVGIIPNLFTEGKGVIASGIFKGNILHSDELMAKHDEYYKPPDEKLF